MVKLSDLLADLRYDQSSYYRNDESQFEPETAHLFRAARKVGVDGIYVFQASSNTGPNKEILPARPAVYVAQANTIKEAGQIHRRLWNLRYDAPFANLRAEGVVELQPLSGQPVKVRGVDFIIAVTAQQFSRMVIAHNYTGRK